MSSFVAEINKLKNIQQRLEKYESCLVENLSKCKEHKDICEFYAESLKSRAHQEKQLHNEIRQVFVPLRKIKKSLKKENIQNLDVKEIKKEMTEIQENINNLKDHSQTTLDELKKEEKGYNEELETFKEKLEKWENRPTYSASKMQFKRTSVFTQANICKEAQDFMDFVAGTGGHENGWTPEDHALFLKVKNKTKDPRRVAEIIHMLLPDISEEAVAAHEQWYEKYLELKEKQKDAIKHWRITRGSTKQISSSLEKVTSELPPANNNNNSTSEAKEDVEQKLVAWKREKLLRTEYEKEQKRQELAKQKELEELKKQKQEELKLQVQNWRLLKDKAEREELLKKQEEEMKEQRERSLKANKLIKQYQTQDEIFMQNKLQMLHPSNKVPEVLKKRRNSYQRDPLRLLKPTQQWIMRTHGDNKESGKFTNTMNLQELQKLGLPEWRKCIY